MKKLLSLLLCFVIAFICITPAFADGRDCSLTIIYRDDKTPIDGAKVSIYRVGEADGDRYVLCDDFRNDPVNLDISSDSASNATAFALYGCAVMNGRTPVGTGTTSEKGIVYFGNLEEGLYLITVNGVLFNGNYYGMSAYLVTLPGIDEETKDVVYDIVSMPKSRILSGSRETRTDLSIMKKWEDTEENHSPVSINIYCDGELYSTVELSSDNEWYYKFEGLDAEHDYVISEKDVPAGYSFSVRLTDYTYVVTNTKDDIITTEPSTEQTTQPGTTNPDGTDDTDNSDITKIVPAVVVPSVIITGVIIGTTTAVIPAVIGTVIIAGVVIIGTPIVIKVIKDHIESKNNEIADNTDEELPYTGVTWWPVPVMASAGVILIAAGAKLRRKKDEEAE